MKTLFIKYLTTIKMMHIRFFMWKPLIRKSLSPRQVQEALLKHILERNKDTKFGKEYDFDKISSYQEYCNQVPVCNYERLRPYVEKQDAGGSLHLNVRNPVMYAQTSGTTGKPKNIPILDSTLKQYKRSQHIAAYSIYKDIPGAYDGKVLAITSPAVEGVMGSGVPYGAMSGLIYQSMPWLMKSKYVLPSRVFEIKNYDQKYYEITKLSLAEKQITMIATANPSTLIKIDQIMAQQAKQLIEDIAMIDHRRASELRQLLAEKSCLVFSDVWPNVKAVTTWTSGNCGVLIPGLRNKMPKCAKFVELGYLASEFRGGINIDVVKNQQIPTLHENFFEFVEKDDWNNALPKFLLLHELEKDKQYYIFATTQNGLYRYNINDLIKVTGRYNNTPTIEFQQKGKGVSNLTGEKLYEGQLVAAMTDLVKNQKMDISFFKMLANPASLEYTLYVENDSLDIFLLEHKLGEMNIEFKEKRKSGRLKPIRLVKLKEGAGEDYKKHCVVNGQREGQFKMIYLQAQEDCTFDFAAYER